MISSLEICKLTVSLLFNYQKTELVKLKQTFIDAEASLLSELSLVNEEIQRTTIFHKQLIESQYIDYLKKEIKTLKDSSLSDETTQLFNGFLQRSKEIADYTPDERIGMDLNYVSQKISNIVDGDILRSQVLEPILKSKSHDFLLLLSEEINGITSKSDKLKNKIESCDAFIEAISFCEYIYLTEIDKRDGVPTILENSYDGLMSDISIKYSKWKGLI